MGQLKVSGDPRKPAEVKHYVPPPITEPTGDIYMLGAFICGGAALFFRSKLAAWFALLVCLSSAANVKTGQADYRSILTAFSFSCMSIVMTYIPTPPRVPPPAAATQSPG